MKYFLIFSAVLFAVLMSACSNVIVNNNNAQECTSDWYRSVDKLIPSTDGRGHGPDLGSTEWRSVIEFRLGVRGNSSIPVLESDEWCDYVNSYFIEPKL